MKKYAAKIQIFAMWQLRRWITEARDANYSNPDDFPVDYANASLDWSNAGDTFYASSYTYSPFTIADGKFFTDEDGNYYSGTLTNEEKDPIGGKTLTSVTSIQLAEEQNVWHAIASPMMDNADGTLAVGQAILVHTDSDSEQLTIAPDGIAANDKKSLPPLPKGMQLSGLDDEDDGTNRTNSNFAYCDGRQLVITQPGRLEAFDALGRRLFVRELVSLPNALPTTLFPATGVYILRLDGKTQKIVIR